MNRQILTAVLLSFGLGSMGNCRAAINPDELPLRVVAFDLRPEIHALVVTNLSEADVWSRLKDIKAAISHKTPTITGKRGEEIPVTFQKPGQAFSLLKEKVINNRQCVVFNSESSVALYDAVVRRKSDDVVWIDPSKRQAFSDHCKRFPDIAKLLAGLCGGKDFEVTAEGPYDPQNRVLFSDKGNQTALDEGGSVFVSMPAAGDTPLHIAASSGNMDAVRLLIKNGAGLDIKNQRKNTPLYLAAQYKHWDCYRVLAKAGADEYSLGYQDQLPITMWKDAHQEKSWQEVEKELEQKQHQEEPRSQQEEERRKEQEQRKKREEEARLLREEQERQEESIKAKEAQRKKEEEQRRVEQEREKEAAKSIKSKQNAIDELFLAIRARDEEWAKKSIAAGADVNAQGRLSVFNKSPLHEAVSENSIEIAQLLLGKGATVNAKDSFGRTPLHLAALEGKVNMVELLVNAGADVNFKDNSGDTPLHEAAMKNYQEIVEILITSEADPLLKNHWSSTPTSLAEGKTKIYLQQAEKDAEKKQIEKEKRQREEKRKKLRSDAERKKATKELHDAITGQDIKKVKESIDNGADVDGRNDSGDAPLHRAAYRGPKEIVQELIDWRADVNVRDSTGLTPLHMAALSGNVEIAKLLIGHKDDKIERKADVNAQNSAGKTPLYMAASGGSMNMIKVLVEAGAKVNLSDSAGVKLINLLGYWPEARKYLEEKSKP